MEIKNIPRKKGELNLPLIYLLVTGTGIFFVYFLMFFKRLPHIPCVFKTLTGYPCPTCGSTRILSSLFHFDIASAFHWNPLIFLMGIVFMIWIFYGFYMLFSRKKIQVILTKKEGLLLRVVLIAVFIFNWLYLAVTGI